MIAELKASISAVENVAAGNDGNILPYPFPGCVHEVDAALAGITHTAVLPNVIEMAKMR